MYIKKLSVINYRNFKNVKLLFNKGINTIIGENASGKSNLFRAIRILLDSSMPRFATKLTESDFCRSLSDWRGHWIIISLEFEDIGSDEVSQSLFLHGVGNAEEEEISKATYNLIFRPKAHIRQSLSKISVGDLDALSEILNGIDIDDYETLLTGKSTADYSDPSVYRKIVGDFDEVKFPKELNHSDIGMRLPNILNMPNEVSFTFIKALRDVVSDFHSNRTNPLLTLLKRKSGDISQTDFEPIADLIGNLNSQIESLPDICDVRSDIIETVSDTVGDAYSPNSLSIKSILNDEPDQLFQSLKLFISEAYDGYEGTINEMSLGGANLLYLTLKLLEFKYQKENQSIANFLLIEEPEAHIHTHIQKTLFDNIKYKNTQIIYSTHSSHISEISNIENMNVIGLVDGTCEAFQPANGLNNEEINFVQRYLDAIRSNLLFARSVILVEGDAEEIIIPVMIREVLGLNLDEIGISLVNIRSTGFENIAILFDQRRIKKRCSIITDSDEAFFDTSISDSDEPLVKKKKEKAIGSQKAGRNRKEKIERLCDNNEWVSSFYADHTFEVDFIKSSNNHYLKELVNEVYVQKATRELAINELDSSDISISGSRALTMANNQGKGWFAIALSGSLDFKVTIPDYIIEAIKFAHGEFNDSMIYKILTHRYESVNEHIRYGKEIITKLIGDNNTELESEWRSYLAPYENGMSIFKQVWDSFDPDIDDINLLKNQMIQYIPSEQNGILTRI